MKRILVTLLVLGCPAITWALPCQEHGAAEVVGTVTERAIDEASGLVASRKHQDVFWVHNDSGDAPVLYAIRRDGSLAATYRVTGADARDWEDIAYGPCPEDPQGCLYIADFGNNSQMRTDLKVYRVPEPDDVPAQGTAPEGDTAQVVSFGFEYPFEGGGQEDSPDAEALMIDPLDGAMYIATKEPAGARVVRIPAGTAPGDDVMIEEIALARVSIVTGGDISPEGDQLVLRNYGRAFVYDKAGTWAETFATNPVQITLPDEPQGEAVAYGARGRDLFTVSEKRDQPVYRYPCVDAPPEPDMGADMDVSDMDAPDMPSSDMTPDMNPSDMAEDMPADMGQDTGVRMDSGGGNNPGEDGCSCTLTPSPAPTSWWWLPLLLVGLMRRSRDHV